MSPLLSVVVPLPSSADSVDPGFVRRCLDSIAVQTLSELEVITVATDENADACAAARELATEDARFRFVLIDHDGGPDAAGPDVGSQDMTTRHAALAAGVAEATGRYLAFTDCDGVVPADAYELMVGVLQQTGSDLCSGNVLRFDDERRRQSPLHAGLFRTRRERTRLADEPRLIRDVTLGNKVFRREFWDAQGLTFDTCDDDRTVVRALAQASSVDVLDTVVQRRAEQVESVTEGLYNWDRLRPRMESAYAVRADLAEHAPALTPAWDEHMVLGFELPFLLEAVPRLAEDRQVELVELGRRLVGALTPGAVAATPAILRLQVHLLGRGKLPELLEVLRFVQQGGLKRTTTVRRGLRNRRYALYPYFEEPEHGVPTDVYDVTGEMRPIARVDRVSWADGRLCIEGHAYIPMLDAAEPGDVSIRLWLVSGRRRRPLRLPVEMVCRPDVTGESKQSAVSHHWSGFRTEIDPQRLKVGGRWQPITRRLVVLVGNQGIWRARTVDRPADPVARWMPTREVEPGVQVQALAADNRMLVRVRMPSGVLTGHRRLGDDLELTGWTTAVDEPVRVVAIAAGRAKKVEARAECTPRPAGGSQFVARLPLAELVSGPVPDSPTDGIDWDLTLNGETKLTPSEDMPDARYPIPGTGPAREFAVTRSRFGNVRGVEGRGLPMVTDVKWRSGDTLELAGSFGTVSADRPTRVLLHHTRSSLVRSVPVEWHDGDRFTVRFAPSKLSVFGMERPLGRGRWTVAMAGPDGEVPLTLQRSLLPGLPGPQVTGFHEVAVTAHAGESLQLRVRTALTADERGEFPQTRLREQVYPRLRTSPVREMALFDSFKGRQFSDNPRGVFEELRRRDTDIECVWVTDDGQFGAPAGARTVLVGSADYYEAVARAKYIFANWAMYPWFDKRPEQTYVQTWHGTPLKKLGYDVHEMPYKRRQVVPWMDYDPRHWDLLLTQNAFSTPLLRRAFGYQGEVLESGYPRNDLLLSPDRELVAQRVRERLGIPAGRKIVMYAPTWRDDFSHAAGRRAFRLELDFERARAALGDDHVLLLRTHYLVTDRPRSTMGGFVFDVSDYPDIAELYLITDVLITDYSSSMFDFAVTGRPMLFYTYDLERYRDHVRGFYFDFEAEAPGPLPRTSDEVIDGIRDVDRLVGEYSERYKAFADKYCPHDDGKAAARVLDRVLDR